LGRKKRGKEENIRGKLGPIRKNGKTRKTHKGGRGRRLGGGEKFKFGNFALFVRSILVEKGFTRGDENWRGRSGVVKGCDVTRLCLGSEKQKKKKGTGSKTNRIYSLHR